EAQGIYVNTASITGGFFDALEIPLVRGRAIAPTDRADTAPVAVINEAFAEQFLPGQDPTGRRAAFFNDPIRREVVGIVRDVAVDQLGEARQRFFYVPLSRNCARTMALHVRTAGDPGSVLPGRVRFVREYDRSFTVGQGQTIAQVLDQTLWSARTGAELLALFSALTLTLVVVGIHGVFGYTVAQRTSEIGLRMALGAEPRIVKREIIVTCLKLTLIGLAVGTGVAILLARLVEGLLFGVAPADPVAFVAAAVLLIVVSLAASFLPSRRAAMVEPLEALRG